jgi:hypothetical protein
MLRCFTLASGNGRNLARNVRLFVIPDTTRPTTRSLVCAMTEIERYIRDRVRATGEPVIFEPEVGRFPIQAIPYWKFYDGEEGVYHLFLGPDLPETDDDWSRATRIAHDTVRKWALQRVEGVTFNWFETALGDEERRVEVSALGLSLLQLALNESGSQIVLKVWS